MPYVAEQKILKTKVRGVTMSTLDSMAQDVLKRMSAEPHTVHSIFVVEMEVYVYFTGSPHAIEIGHIDEKWSHLMIRPCTVLSFSITGGYGDKRCYGCNLTIKVS